MNINAKIEYAMKLANVNSSSEFEELFKLSSLCEEIQTLKNNGEHATDELKHKFESVISEYYRSNGHFRAEVEQFSLAKKLIMSIKNE